MDKLVFGSLLADFAASLKDYVQTQDLQWSIKGFIDTHRTVYSISSDTKIVSKILEIHIFPKLLAFCKQHQLELRLAEHQNYYADVSLIAQDGTRFAVDFKTTFRNPTKTWLCNGFTLGSHGKYFMDRASTKNIQFPYGSYAGHFCLGIIYDRTDASGIDETATYQVEEIAAVQSVISNLQFFVAEKWKIASDKGGSGNTANIGSIRRIEDLVAGRGMFSQLGERWFDDYWMNYKKISISDRSGGTKVIGTLQDFVTFRGGDTTLIVPKNNRR